jgi:hypothetical protein
MKRMMIIAMLALAATVFAAPNFTGTWALDTAKSELPEAGQGRGPGSFMAPAMTVTQDEAAITVERTMPGRDGQERKTTTKMTPDGKVVTETNDRGSSDTKASWDAATLVVETSRKFEREGQTFEMKRSEKWTLSADGKVLTIAFTQTSQRGDSTGKAVYTKK